MIKAIKILLTIVLVNTIFINRAYGLEYNDEIKIDLLIMMVCYDDIIDIEKNEEKIYFILKNGVRILYNDDKKRTVEEISCSSNIKDILNQYYPLNSINEVMPRNNDPGRGRNYKLLDEIYGEGENNIYSNLKYIDTEVGTILFTGKNRGDIAIKNALNKCVQLSKKNTTINKFIHNRGGTFNYRRIQDTGLLSPHAYGIAIDLKKDERDYWKWVDEKKGSQRICEYPIEMIEAFEENGFIWGGKWNHFDSLHFEYRPEIILKAKIKEKIKRNGNDEWFYYFDRGNEVNEYIDKINKLKF